MKVFFYSILIFLFSITLYSQDKPSLIENSLRMVDLQPYSGKIEPQKIRLGIYLNEVKIENPPQGFPADLKGYVIWHIMPHWTADEAGYYIGDTLIGLEGKPLYDSVDRGDNYLELYLRNKKEGDIIKLTGLKNGKVLEKKVKLIGIRYVDMPCIDPGIGSVRSSWLAEEINKHGLDDWTLEIRKQMATCANSDFCTVPFAGRYNPWRLNAVTYLHRNPTRLSAYSGIIVNDIWEGIEFEHGLVGAVKAAAKHLDIPDVNFPLPELPTSPEDFEEFFAKVQNELDIAYNPVKNDLDSIVKELMSLLKMEGGWEEGLDTLKNEAEKRKIRLIKEKELAELFGKADKVDLFALVAAAKMLAAMIEPAWVNEFSKNIFELLKDSVNNDRIELKKNDETIYWETSYGKCAIGGSGHNFYKGDYCLIIDLSGDDVY
ncbi:MAG: hypothetical protein QG635_1336, partial [Bacteroidota bacterium]|nr:hypothetical protein [Bacteroidota bacterium]